MTPLFLAVGGPLWLIYLRTLSPTVPLEDGGEMIRAASCLGVTHPPGYPLYTLAGRLFMALPAGDPGFRMNLLSAACSATACGVLACVAWTLMERRERHWLKPAAASFLISAAAAGLALGLGPGPWWQAVIAEKYAANLLLNALVLAACARSLADGRPALRSLSLLGLAYGVSAAHHGQTAYLAPAAFVAGLTALRRAPARARARAAGFACALLLLGLSVKLLYPPVRASAHPVHNWLNPHNVTRYLYYAAATPYQYRLFYWSPLDAARRLRDQLAELPAGQFGWAGVALALAGLGWSARRRRAETLALGGAWAAGTFYCANFVLSGQAIRTYYHPVLMITALWLARGIQLALAPPGRLRRRVLLGCLAAWLGWMALTHGREARRDRSYVAYDFSRALLADADPGCILVAYSDYDLFPLWFQQDVLGRAPRTIIADSDFPPQLGPAGASAITLVYPLTADAYRRILPDVGRIATVDPGRPVWFTVVYDSLEGFPLLPRGIAYRYERDPSALGRADILGEWRRWRRRRVVRGAYDPAVPKDSATRIPLHYWGYGDYRRGRLLADLRRWRDALEPLRAAVAWPCFSGLGAAGAHAELGRCARALGRPGEAAREFAAAVKAAPRWAPGLRALAASEWEQGRRKASRDLLRRAAESDAAEAAAASVPLTR